MSDIVLDKTDFNSLAAVAEEYEASIYKDYSGRAMYGDICMGIYGDIDEGDANQIILNALGNEMLGDIIVNTRSDNLGLGTIYYYPSVRFDF
jgi:hypothetical protein